MASIACAPQEQSLLLKMPGEIRNKIYAFVFESLEIYKFRNGNSETYCIASNRDLLQTCRQIYKEAHMLAFKHSTFYVIPHTFISGSQTQFLNETKSVKHVIGNMTLPTDKASQITTLAIHMPNINASNNAWSFFMPDTRIACRDVIDITRSPQLPGLKTLIVLGSAGNDQHVQVFEEWKELQDMLWRSLLATRFRSLDIEFEDQQLSEEEKNKGLVGLSMVYIIKSKDKDAHQWEREVRVIVLALEKKEDKVTELED